MIFIGETVHDVFKWEHPLVMGSTFLSTLSLRSGLKKEGQVCFPARLAQGHRTWSEEEWGKVTSFGHAQYDGRDWQIDIMYYDLGNRGLGMPMREFSDWVN